MSNGEVRIDPLTGDLCLGFGIGFARISSPFADADGDIDAVIVETGIDQLLAGTSNIIHKPGHPLHNNVLTGFQDRCATQRKLTDHLKPMTEHLPNYNQSIMHGTYLKELRSDPMLQLLCVYDPSEHDVDAAPAKSILISTQGGKFGTFAKIPGTPLSGWDRNGLAATPKVYTLRKAAGGLVRSVHCPEVALPAGPHCSVPIYRGWRRDLELEQRHRCGHRT